MVSDQFYSPRTWTIRIRFRNNANWLDDKRKWRHDWLWKTFIRMPTILLLLWYCKQPLFAQLVNVEEMPAKMTNDWHIYSIRHIILATLATLRVCLPSLYQSEALFFYSLCVFESNVEISNTYWWINLVCFYGLNHAYEVEESAHAVPVITKLWIPSFATIKHQLPPPMLRSIL